MHYLCDIYVNTHHILDVQETAKETAPGEGGEGEAKNADVAESHDVPDYKTQKEEIQPLLAQRLKKGDEW